MQYGTSKEKNTSKLQKNTSTVILTNRIIVQLGVLSHASKNKQNQTHQDNQAGLHFKAHTSDIHQAYSDVTRVLDLRY